MRMYVYMYTKNSFRIYLCTNSTLWKLLLTSQIVENFNDGQGQVLRQKYKTLNFVEAGKILTGLYWPKGEEYIMAKNPQLKKMFWSSEFHWWFSMLLCCNTVNGWWWHYYFGTIRYFLQFWPKKLAISAHETHLTLSS